MDWQGIHGTFIISLDSLLHQTIGRVSRAGQRLESCRHLPSAA
jgi:hypothetical protein